MFTDIKVHPDLAVRTGGTLAIAFRKENPKLRAVVDEWVLKHGRGDTLRAVLEQRYLKNVKFAKNATTDAERRKFREVVELFRKYGGQYEIDYLLMAAQGYQESTLDNNVKSPVGAVGVMQVMPPTGKRLNVGDIHKLEPNIHAGVKYMRFMMDQYFKGESIDPLNKGLMTFAGLQRRAGSTAATAAGGSGARAQPQRLVRQCRARRIRADRPRDGDLCQQHLQVLHLAYKLLSAQFDRRADAKAQIRKSQ